MVRPTNSRCISPAKTAISGSSGIRLSPVHLHQQWNRTRIATGFSDGQPMKPMERMDPMVGAFQSLGRGCAGSHGQPMEPMERMLRLALRFRVLGERSPVGRCNALWKCVAPVMSPLPYNSPRNARCSSVWNTNSAKGRETHERFRVLRPFREFRGSQLPPKRPVQQRLKHE